MPPFLPTSKPLGRVHTKQEVLKGQYHLLCFTLTLTHSSHDGVCERSTGFPTRPKRAGRVGKPVLRSHISYFMACVNVDVKRYICSYPVRREMRVRHPYDFPILEAQETMTPKIMFTHTRDIPWLQPVTLDREGKEPRANKHTKKQQYCR